MGSLPRLACVDVDYRGLTAVGALFAFENWTAAVPNARLFSVRRSVAPYRSGELYRRELPSVLELLDALPEVPDIVIVDGYCWLDPEGTRPGLGGHLHEALYRSVPVVGVAKTPHPRAHCQDLLRGEARTPLHVSAAGLPLERAVEGVRSMHGPFRLPTLLKGVDRACRDYVDP